MLWQNATYSYSGGDYVWQSRILGARVIRRRQGIDLSLINRKIPAE